MGQCYSTDIQPRFDVFVKSKTKRQEFVEFLKNERSCNNFHFYEDINKFLLVLPTINIQTAMVRGDRLITMYIDKNAITQVNISSAVTKNIERIFGGTDTTIDDIANVFKQVKYEMAHLIQNDSYKRFQQHRQHQKNKNP